MNRRTFVRPEAQINIREIAVWYEQRETGLGHRFMAEIRQALESISRTPLRFPIIENGVRRLLLRRFPYAIYFLWEDESAIVIAVLHQHRDPEMWKRW
ncbi:MAG TPA: type II toxin-antitoxin system RelE/ParE family toxin [Pyrinomonadaceae bacterium]|jgi:plasmid stabilization system protein ParE|nr:type II toxin-antitoxin system RelE/ParE family toxin [Pyrinomonadaceae bacterium]